MHYLLSQSSAGVNKPAYTDAACGLLSCILHLGSEAMLS